MLRLLPFVFILCLLVGCTKKEVYSEFRDIPAKGWNRYDTLSFTPNLSASGVYNISLETRNRADYPYQNVWFFVSGKQDSTVIFSDTVQLILADKMGKWSGSGWGSLYELSTPYKQSFHFIKSNKPLVIKIVQGMRDFDLQGLESVGLTMKPVN